ncbi:MCE family protein [Hanstruepera neustonica]|uniref:MCE family protein n=1 Tax=Hanstruepera neustonica TaxID=1445657 RepID=A0A2K1DY90_9FLAO|nr:MlaD family protein [Hanstruepera neustonica]PNQ72988.1 MCE family protein [Hanstruepera neustonica]
MKITKEVKTAILVILGIAFLIFGINYLKGRNLLDASNTYYTEFEYNALTESSPVTIKGNNVGKIKKIKYDFETGKTRVSFTVDEGLKFSKNSKIRLYEMGLMGGNGMAIIPAEDNQFAQDGDVIQSEVERGLLDGLAGNFSDLSTGLDTTLKSADSLLIGLNAIVEDDSDKGLKNAIAELNATIKSFRNLSYSFNSLIAKNEKNLTSVISNFDSISQDLASLSNDLKKAEISKTIDDLDTALLNFNTLLTNLDNGEGTVGKLLKDDELYNNLEGATKELEELLRDIKLHPKRYFRILSKKEIPYEDDSTDQ